jgi:Tol biopolymer transport system component
MSPEQLEDGDVDHRSDIFSLGVMLYEMSTGKRPFGGGSAISVVSSIIKDTPSPVREHRPELPHELERIVRRCLNKDVRERFQTALDVRNELKDLQTDVLTGHTGSYPALPRRRRPVLPIGLGMAAVAAVIILGIFGPHWLRTASGEPETQPQEVAHFDSEHAYHFATPQPWSFDPEPESHPALSYDGSQLAFSRTVNGFEKIFIQPVDRSTPPRQVTFPISVQGDEARKQVVFAVGRGSFEIAEDTDDIMPTWSPDGKTLAFVRASEPSGRILPSDIYGGFYAHNSCDVWTLRLDDPDAVPQPFMRRATHPTYNADGWMAFEASLSGAYRRGLKQITDDPDSVVHLEPTWSPDGKKIAFRRQPSKYGARIAVVDVETRKSVDITGEFLVSEPAWSPPGDYVYFTANPSSGFNLWRVPVNAEGEPTGDIQPVTVGAGRDLSPTLSQDGRTLAYSQIGWNADLWILPIDPETGQTKGPPRPLIQSSREDTRASWSVDERWIVFTADREGLMNLYVAPFDAEQGTAGLAHRITSGSGGDYQPQWSPDGTSVIFFSKRSGNEEIWAIDLDEHKQPQGELRRLTDHRASDTNPFVSPDGEWIAFHSDRSGSVEVWLMRPDGTGQTNLFQVETGGHYIPWYDESSYFAGGKRFYLDGREPERILPFGGAHLQFSPDRRLFLENDHRNIKLGLVSPETTSTNVTVLLSHSAPTSIDYTVWSPSGRWVIFDRNVPVGGDIYLLSELQ